MALRESPLQESVRVLYGTRCVCGDCKARGCSFCLPCYLALPPEMRSKLRRSTWENYAEIWDEARCYLREQTDRPVK